MARLTTYILLMSGLMLLFYFTGLATDNPLLTLLLNPENMSTSTFYATLLTVIVTSVGAIVIGIVTKNIELAAMTAFVPFFLGLMWNFISVFNEVASGNREIAILIFAPFLLLFLIAMLDWWRGKDS